MRQQPLRVMKWGVWGRGDIIVIWREWGWGARGMGGVNICLQVCTPLRGSCDTAFHKSYSWAVISLGDKNSPPQRVITAPIFPSKACMSLTVKRRQRRWKETLLSWEIRSMKVRSPCKSLMCSRWRCRGGRVLLWKYCHGAESGRLQRPHHYWNSLSGWTTFSQILPSGWPTVDHKKGFFLHVVAIEEIREWFSLITHSFI